MLKVGDLGDEVGKVQQLLVEAGETVDPGDLRTSLFGQSTLAAVRDFQASHVQADGSALTVDGLVGDETLAALRLPRTAAGLYTAPGWSPGICTSDPEATVCRVAIAEIGVAEYPPASNRGPRVDQYEGEAWLGVPWCALFASWCWAQAPGGSPFGIKASALKIRDWGANSSALIGTKLPARPGDIAVILRQGGRGHVELVVADEQIGRPLSLVGGNVGNAVRGTVRSRDTLTALVRPMRAIPA
jgi:hypothetical protein